jgi:hypothetical protein
MHCRRYFNVNQDILFVRNVDRNSRRVQRAVDHWVHNSQTNGNVHCLFVFLGNIRNLGMEKVADTILFPCKYQTNGCLLNLMHKTKLEHEDSCDFRPVINYS